MARTIRRSPLTVSTSSSDYPTLQTFNHVEFKGISSGTNELVVDQSSFADANNIYLDKDYNLVSRPPLKLCANESGEFEGQIRTWTFGAYRVTYARKIKAASPTETIPGQVSGMRSVYCYSPTASSGFNVRKDRVHEIVIGKTIYTSGSGENKKFYVLENEVAYEVYKAKFVFEFYINGSCLISLSRSIFGAGVNTIPDANCALIGDKIFIWFDGTDLFCYDTTKKELVDAADYIYTPILKQVVNGFESELETKNFLTSTYKKRYQYSTLSDVNFNSLIGENVEVRLLGDARTDTSAHLYDATVNKNSAYSLIYPYAHIGDYKLTHIDTARAQIFLRYNENYTDIAISFNAKHFRSLPYLHDVISEPIFSNDGFYVIAFTLRGIAVCDISNTDDYTWNISPYFELLPDTFALEEVRTTFRPKGVFASKDDFAYIVEITHNLQGTEGSRLCVYSEYVREGKRMYAFFDLLSLGISFSALEDSDWRMKMSFSATSNREMTIAMPFKNVSYNSNTFAWALITFSPLYYEAGSSVVTSQKVAVNPADTEPTSANNLVLNDFVLETYAGVKGELHGTHIRVRTAKRSSSSPKDLYIFEDITFIGSEEILVQNVSTDVWSYTNVLDEIGPISFDSSGSVLTTLDRVLILNEENHEDYPSISLSPKRADSIVSNTDGYPWYLIGGELWTSQRTDDNTLLLDVTITGENNFSVPDHWRELNEHYFVFNAKETGQNNRLEITQARKSEDGRDLLYLPEYNSQILANKMTNLWPLTDTIMGVFTEKELYYVGAVTADDARISYTKLMKSKTEIGCREGDEIVVSQDGQTLLLPTRRGITAMQASALLDTSAQSLSYLSDPISHIYKEFYDAPVISLALDRISGNSIVYDPAIKITLYGQNILFYKYMAKDILVFDTRNGSWWKWTLPYPIRQLQATDHYGIYSLIAYLQIDFTAHEYGKLIHSENDGYLPSRLSTLGNMFVFTPEFTRYQDELIPGALLDVDTLSDDFKKIDWHAMSQRLHFNAINNYKCIKSIGLMAKGDGLLELKLQTKAYRDFYHPEYSSLFEFNVNEQRTFFKKTNMMHLTNFQYTMSNIDDDDTNIPLSLNSICIKYEVKEAIR